MKKLRKILVAIADLHNVPGGALRRAAGLALATGDRVELVHCVTSPRTESRRLGKRLVDVQLSAEGSLAVAQKALERIARSKLLQGCQVESVAVSEQPSHEAIVRRALATHSDLIINGTRSRALADRLVLRHTDWEMVRHSPVPLLLVKSDRQAGRAVILAAIDPLHANSKPARLDGRILDAATGMATVLKGTLHAFHSYMPLSVILAAGSGEPVVLDCSELDANQTRDVEREFNRELRRTGSRALGGICALALPHLNSPRVRTGSVPRWWSWAPFPDHGLSDYSSAIRQSGSWTSSPAMYSSSSRGDSRAQLPRRLPAALRMAG